ncbi:hypothetical protein [Reyranella sp.]|uniref:hypothetical protein n=1 Tax=Reyranella sp. TaxID=1929291 RepID=UPI003D14CB92
MAEPEYARSLAECYNSFPLSTGDWVRRPPFRSIGYTRHGAPARLIPLASETAHYYNMEMSDGHFRFIHGSTIVTDATRRQVTFVSTDNPAEITVDAAHGWATGDQVVFAPDGASASGVAALTARVFVIEVTATDKFKLHDLVTGKGINGLLVTWLDTLVVYVAKITDVETPYVGDTWQAVNRVQTDKEVLTLHPAFWPRVLTYDEAGEASWTNIELSEAQFKDGPYLDRQVGSVATPTGTSGIILLDFGFEAWESTKAYDEGSYVTYNTVPWISLQTENVNNTPADGSAYWERRSALDFLPNKTLTTADIGRHVRMFSEPADWSSGTSYTDGDKVKFEGSYWSAIASVSGDGSGRPGADPTKWVPAPSAARWTWGKIVSIAGGTEIPAADQTGKIGNLTGGSGLAGLFDGNTTSVDKAGPTHPGTSAFAGLQLATPTEVSGGHCYPALSSAKTTTAANRTGLGIVDDILGVFEKHTGFLAPGLIFGRLFGARDVGGSAGTYTFAVGQRATVTINLRAKTGGAPSSASDGTLLGSSGGIPYNRVTSAPIYVASNDATSTWDYVWFEVLISLNSGNNSQAKVCAAEMKFFSAGGEGSAANVQVLGKELLYTGTGIIRNWRLGRYNFTDPEFPVTGCYADGRLWLASGKNHFDASKAGEPFVFSPTEEDGTVTDASAISYSFNSEVNAPIQWMHPGDTGIVLGLTGGERLIYSTTQQQIITPTNIKAELKTSYTSSPVLPVQAPISSLFVHSNGRDIHEYMRDASSGRFVAPPLTQKAKSLTEGGIIQIAYQRALTSMLWVVTADGKLSGTTYERSYLPFRSESPPEMNGWHWHEHGGPRDFVSVSVGPSIDGSPVEAPVVITRDRETALHRIELMGELMPEDNDIFDCNYLDGMFAPPSAGTASVVPPSVEDPEHGVDEEEPEPEPGNLYLFVETTCPLPVPIFGSIRVNAVPGGWTQGSDIPPSLTCTGGQVPDYDHGDSPITIPASSSGGAFFCVGKSTLGGARMTLNRYYYFSERATDIIATYSLGAPDDDYIFTEAP